MKVMAFALTAVLAICSACYGAPRVLEVSPESLEFAGYAGGGDPNAQVVSIWNSGSGPMDWQVTEDCGWLTVEPNSGTSSGEVDDVNVIVDISGLEGGVYNCSLTVDAGTAVNSPQIVDVNLVVVISQPAIELSDVQFNFRYTEGGEEPNDQVLGISNSGGGTLNWEISYDCNWLFAGPNSGSSTGEVDDVNLSLDISGFTGGVYECELLVSDSNATNSPQIVWVTAQTAPFCEWCPGDADGDNDIDLSDYYAIQGTISYGCYFWHCPEDYRIPCDDGYLWHLYDECMDTDRDCDVDLDDYYDIQGLLSYADYLLSGGAGISYLIDGPNAPIVGHLWPCE